MVIVTGMDKLYSLDARGRFGFSNGYGAIKFGDNRRGLFVPMSGIYTRKVYGKGAAGRPSKRGNKWACSRMKFYRPTNRQTPRQQAWRAVFAAGKVAFDALTDAELAVLFREARGYRMSEYNLFMSRWLNSHRL